MYDKTIDDYVSEFTEIQEQLKSCYENYCKICEGTPLSYDEWLHADVSYDVYNDLPF